MNFSNTKEVLAVSTAERSFTDLQYYKYEWVKNFRGNVVQRALQFRRR